MWRAILVLAAVLPSACLAQAVAYRIDPVRTHAEFQVEQLGVFRAHGRFASVSGRLLYDPPARSGSIELVIPVDSVATGWDSRDRFLRGDSMFDAAQFPRMQFVSRRLGFEGSRVVLVEGDLTLRDVTRPVTLSVHALQCDGDTCMAEATGAIRRREFGMDAWWPLIGDDVQLLFRLVAVKS